MRKKQLLLGSGAIICALSLSGCASMVGTLPQNFTFNKKQNEGVAALTLQCSVAAGAGDLTIDQFGDGKKAKIINTYDAQFNCTDSFHGLGKVQLKLLHLPKGIYAISNWTITSNGYPYYNTMSPNNFDPIFFGVNPHKVTYVGRIRLMLSENSNNNYNLRILNKAQQDIPLIHQALPNVSKQAVRIYLAGMPRIKGTSGN